MCQRMANLVVESLEVVVRVHGGLQPQLLRLLTESAVQGAASLLGKGGSCAQHMQRVVLPVACCCHVPGQLVQPRLNVLVILSNNQ